MSKRYGAVIVFREGVTKTEAAVAMAGMGHAIDWGYYAEDGKVLVREQVEEFDDSHGGPVWYIP